MILALFFWFSAAQTYRYWVQPCSSAEMGCEASDQDLADWALRAWQDSSGGQLQFTKVQEERQAHIRLYWAGPLSRLYGEARPIMVEGQRGAEVYILPAQKMEDSLLRESIVYLTCLHETGHALGLDHTAKFQDIMYSFRYGGDIPEYFGRYRRKLKVRDDIRKNPGMSDDDRKHLAAVLSK